MAMSHDYVEFRYDGILAGEAGRRAAEEAFGLNSAQVRGSNLTIRCRPSQFARFLILRNDYGGKNGFKELQPRLVSPNARHGHVVDCIKRPNSLRYTSPGDEK